ncbi:MAG: NADH-quinone oxidoreductase subunit C [Planctomycetota bacterium]
MSDPQIYNCQATHLTDIPRLSLPEFRSRVIRDVAAGARISALFGCPARALLAPQESDSHSDAIRLFAVLSRAHTGDFAVFCADAEEHYPSLTPECVQAHWFEREIAEQWGLKPEGHPWLKPIRFHASYRAGRDAWRRSSYDEILPSVMNFFRVKGAEVHEVAVGPVHAGVIEPGHFRFQCHGENVLHLEISLGYQHRGVERALIGGPCARTIHLMETLAGDTSCGHATAYCQAVEALAGARVPARAQAWRGIALELERLANHSGDLGALAGDIGYLPTASYCGRLRGDFLNMTALLCGSRFGRSLIRPGGVCFDVGAADIDRLRERLRSALRDVTSAATLLWKTPSVMARFEETGRISRKDCEALGLVGLVARACGVERDARFEFPSGIFQFAHIPISVWQTGDVLARAYIRWLEIQRSAAFIEEQLKDMPESEITTVVDALAPQSLVVSLVEGWRGEICHVALTDANGHFAHYKVVDTSFHNWMGLALAMRDQPISDFPLCNKSFNLSYCGHDL